MLRRRSAIRAFLQQKLLVALLMAGIAFAGMYLGVPAATILLAVIISYCVIFCFSGIGLATVTLGFLTVCGLAFLLP